MLPPILKSRIIPDHTYVSGLLPDCVLTWHTVSCGDLRGTFFATWLVLRSYCSFDSSMLCVAILLRSACTDLV